MYYLLNLVDSTTSLIMVTTIWQTMNDDLPKENFFKQFKTLSYILATLY